MDKFELVRYGLKKWGLINEGPSKKDRKCGNGYEAVGCFLCLTTQFCTTKVRQYVDTQTHWKERHHHYVTLRASM